MTNSFTALTQTRAGRSSSHRSELLGFFAVLALGLGLRLWFLKVPGYTVDVTLFTEWTDGLMKIPFGEYLGLVSPWCDYLPGYLYLLAATGRLKGLLTGGGVFPVQDFEPWIKAGPIAADLALAATVYALARKFTSGRRSLLASSLILLNPSILFVGSVWGQVESIATALYMLALLALVYGSPIAAAVLAGIGFVTKPQYAVFLAPAGVAYARWVMAGARTSPFGVSRTGALAWIARRAAVPVLALIGTVQALLVPFSISLWPSAGADWTFYERVTMAEIGKFASAGAFNFWGTQIAGIRKLDSIPGWFSLTYETWGYILFAAVTALSLGVAWRRNNDPEAVLWASCLLAFGFFEVVTKMHERYLFAAIVLSAPLAAFRPRVAIFCAALSALYYGNLWYMWTYGSDIFANLKLTQWASDLSVLLFVIALAATLAVARSPRRGGSTDSPLWGRIVPPGTGTGKISRVLGRRITITTSGALVAIALAVGLGLAAGGYIEARSTLAGSPFKTATVRAYRSNWQDTGVNVAAGDRVSIVAKGTWGHQHEGRLYGPAGNGEVPDWNIVPTAPTGVLLGRIGNSDPFVVGESTTFTADSAGPLLLVMNDGRKGYDDNRGRVQVVVTLTEP